MCHVASFCRQNSRSKGLASLGNTLTTAAAQQHLGVDELQPSVADLLSNSSEQKQKVHFRRSGVELPKTVSVRRASGVQLETSDTAALRACTNWLNTIAAAELIPQLCRSFYHDCDLPSSVLHQTGCKWSHPATNPHTAYIECSYRFRCRLPWHSTTEEGDPLPLPNNRVAPLA